MHVRRGDVTEKKYGDTDRWVSNQDVAECIERAYIEMGGVDVEVHIFSEGHEDDFPELKEMHPKGHQTITPTFHLNTPANHLTDMFNRFVSADGFLLGARSRDRPRVHVALPLSRHKQTSTHRPCTLRRKLALGGGCLSAGAAGLLHVRVLHSRAGAHEYGASKHRRGNGG